MSSVHPGFAVTGGADVVRGTWDGSRDVAFASRRDDGYEAVYVGSAPMPAELLRDIGRRAGVHLWSTQTDIVYANAGAAMVVATTPGDRQINLPSPMAPVEGGASASTFELTLEQGDVRIYAAAIEGLRQAARLPGR